MSVIDKISSISETLSKVFNYATQDAIIKEDFDEYLKTIGAYNSTQAEISSILVTYVFERNLNKGADTVFSLYLKNNSEETQTVKLIQSFQNSIDALFEVKGLEKQGFNLTSLVNEKKYFAMPLVKMSHLRGIYKGSYLLARIFKYENEYFIIEIRDTYSSLDKDKVLKFAVAKIIEQPENLYKDNPEKLSEIETQIAQFTDKFTQCFQSDEIVTTNEFVDQLISDFNDYYFDSTKTPDEIKELIKPIETYAYFKVPEFNSNYDNYIENSMSGFSSHSSKYDVGVIFDKELGMFIVPFYGTLCHIFETENHTDVQGWEDCIKSFIENDKIPAKLVERLATKYSNFMDVINQLYGTQMNLEELLNTYKADYLKSKIYSPTSVLYASKAFSDLMGFIPSEKELKATEIRNDNAHNIGRNDPCPCGSGKKYKKCCGAMV